MAEKCIFCRIANGEVPVKKIYENDNFISFPDANPQVEGHSLVVPKKHFDTLLDMPASLGQELLDCIKNTTIKLMKEHKAEGFNLVNNNMKIAGQIVNHAHFHILPRKKGDKVKQLY